MGSWKRLAVSVGTAATLALAALSPAAAASMTSSGCVAYTNNQCTEWQDCTLDAGTGHGSCTYSYVIRGRWVEVYTQAF
jgi:hypothetical protein